MKILLTSFYDLGKQPKIIAEIVDRYNSSEIDFDFFDFSVEDQNIDLENYDVLGIYAPMHTATILSIEYIKDKKLPNKMFTFGLYGSVLEDFNSSIRYIKDIESDELALFLEINDDHQFSLKNNIPNRQIFPDISNYAHLVDGSNNLIAGSVETTYGCKHSCTHCPVPISFNGSFKTYSLEKIVSDVENQVKQGAKHISFNDPDFFNGPIHALKILESLNEKFPSITYDSTIKVEHIIKYKKYFKELSSLNMVFVISAFETTNDLVLSILEKNHTSNDLNNSIEISQDFGIDIRPTWMPFSPWTELNDLSNIVKLIEKYELRETVDPIQLTIKLLIPKHSLIIKKPEINKYLGNYEKNSLSFKWEYENNDVEKLQSSLFDFILNNSELDEHKQYLGMVNIIEKCTDTKLLTNSSYDFKNVPKLSETWFCCAEPSKIQLDRIKTNKALI
ncbi:MAG: radical SAM protein [Candidatus Actinomarina sp.]